MSSVPAPDLLTWFWEQTRANAKGQVLLDASKSKELDDEKARAILEVLWTSSREDLRDMQGAPVWWLLEGPNKCTDATWRLVLERGSWNQHYQTLQATPFTLQEAQALWAGCPHTSSVEDLTLDEITWSEKGSLCENKHIPLPMRAVWAQSMLDSDQANSDDVNTWSLEQIVKSHKRKKNRLTKGAPIRVIETPYYTYPDKGVRESLAWVDERDFDDGIHVTQSRYDLLCSVRAPCEEDYILEGHTGIYIRASTNDECDAMNVSRKKSCLLLMEDGHCHHMAREFLEVL